jgi:hypothetical protein
MSETRKKVRYVPAPQQSETIALTEEDLRKMVRRMVREELANIRTEQTMQLPDWARKQVNHDTV